MEDTKNPGYELNSAHIFRDILESVNDAVVIVDVHQRICFFNAMAEKIFGYGRDEVLGKDLTLIISEDYQEKHRGFLSRCLDRGGLSSASRTRQCTARRKDGSPFPIEKSYSSHKVDDQMFFTAIVRDISSKLEMERQLQFAQRHADVGKAISHVVHEIRNPLMLIGGFARQLERCQGIQGDTKNLNKLHIIIEEIQRLEELLEGVLVLRRPASAAKKQRLDINELIREVRRLLEPRLANRSVRLLVEPYAQPLETHADPDQIKQVLLNLLYNALDATGGSGTIRVKSSIADDKIRIEIQDTGPGIPEELRSRIFDPFFTTKTHGTGLGLAISRNIVGDHNGSITVECPDSGGTTFVIELPLASSVN